MSERSSSLSQAVSSLTSDIASTIRVLWNKVAIRLLSGHNTYNMSK